MDGISLIVPTFMRPDGLARAVESLLAQSFDTLPVEIIIADNSPKADARDYIADLVQSARWPLRYLHVPEPGVSNARNAAIGAARYRYIAWLDDDQAAAPNWLQEYLDTLHETGAALAFCPSIPVLFGKYAHDPFFITFFSREGPAETTLINDFHGCGNSFMDRSLCPLPSPVFNPAANETGGEDDQLFSYLMAQGAVIAWTPDTHIKETIQAWRASPGYLRKRSFGFGQGPSRISASAGGLKRLGVVKWTIIGAMQTLLFGALATGLTVSRHKDALKYQCKTMEGLGKIFWYKSFRPRLYGAPKLDLKARLQSKLGIKD